MHTGFDFFQLQQNYTMFGILLLNNPLTISDPARSEVVSQQKGVAQNKNQSQHCQNSSSTS